MIFLARKNVYFQTKVFSFLLLLVLLSSCFSVRPTSLNSGKKHFETFYIGEEETQYFIKPILFENKVSNESLLVDFTFKYKDELKDSVTVNFSVKSPNIYKSVDVLEISNNKKTVNSNKVRLLFNEKSNKEFVSRFTAKISLLEMRQLFHDNNWTVNIYIGRTKNKYDLNKKGQSIIGMLDGKVFGLMEK